MRSIGIVPVHVVCDSLAKRLLPKRYGDTTQVFLFDRSDEPLDDGNAAMFANGSIAKGNISPLIPASCLEVLGNEL